MSSIISEELKFNNKIRVTLKDAQTNEIITIVESPNTVVNVGKQLILDSMGGSTPSGILHGAVGLGIGSTSAGSTLLKTELARNTYAYTRAGTLGTFSVFFNTSQANSGEIREIGFFGGISSNISVNTGTMFNRILLTSGITKTSNYTLTVDLDVGFT